MGFLTSKFRSSDALNNIWYNNPEHTNPGPNYIENRNPFDSFFWPVVATRSQVAIGWVFAWAASILMVACWNYNVESARVNDAFATFPTAVPGILPSRPTNYAFNALNL